MKVSCKQYVSMEKELRSAQQMTHITSPALDDMRCAEIAASWLASMHHTSMIVVDKLTFLVRYCFPLSWAQTYLVLLASMMDTSFFVRVNQGSYLYISFTSRFLPRLAMRLMGGAAGLDGTVEGVGSTVGGNT